VRDNGQLLGPVSATLPELLGRQGYQTGAFVSGFTLRSFVVGLDRGFDLYDDRLDAGAGGSPERRAPDTTAAALAWARKAKPPWFLWVHYFDPHGPYAPPKAYWRPGLRGAYEGEVSYADHWIGELRKGLAALAAPPALTVFTADHGEGFGEHNLAGHGFALHDETVLVPLVFHYPGRLAPREIRSPARLVDVAPTLLALLGLPSLPGADGVSLVPLLEGRAQPLPPAYLETYEPWLTFGWAPLKAIRDERWKYVAAPRPELFDLQADPGETASVLATHRPQARELARRLEEVEARGMTGSAAPGDPETLERLRALGYLGAAGLQREPPRDLPDPKDRLAERQALLEAEDLKKNGKPEQAVQAFEAILARQPRSLFALSRLGLTWLERGDYARAVAPLQAAVSIDPERVDNVVNLALALTHAGRGAEAMARWRQALQLQPRRAESHWNLGLLLARDGRAREAIDPFRQAAELEPRNARYLADLGWAESVTGDRTAALTHLQSASRLDSPEAFRYPATLGLLLLRQGETEPALPWLRHARKGESAYAEARLELARLEVRAGNDEAALRALQEALAAEPRLRQRATTDPALAGLLR
jgi:Flp pilus assembly protein TadD